MIHYPTAEQTLLLSDKLLARMEARDKVKMRGRGRCADEELIASLRGILTVSQRKVGRVGGRRRGEGMGGQTV